VGIIDFGRGSLSPSLLTQQDIYIAMNLVKGTPLDKAWRDMPAPTLLRILEQLLTGVAYLHNCGVLHMDLKPANVMYEAGTDNVVLIDLGFSVVADLDRFEKNVGALPGQLREEQCYVSFTPTFARESRTSQRGQTLERDAILRDWFPDHDLFAIGKIISMALLPESGVHFDRWPAIREGLVRIVESLLAEKVAERYPDAATVLNNLHKLQPGYLAPLGVQELAYANDTYGRITTSLATVPISSRVHVITNHPFYQRLRQISQLDVMSLLYPDAKHTRFSHSLLTFNFTREALMSMVADVSFRLSVDAADIEGTLLFALLHDLGHYPLSHMFEDYANEVGDDPIQSDEQLFEVLMKGGQGSASSAQAAVANLLDGNESIDDLVKKTFGADAHNAMWSIARCVVAQQKPDRDIHGVLSALISSAADVDKLSYLSLDSAMSGVPFGRGIDLQGWRASLRDPGPGNRFVLRDRSYYGVLAIEEKGLAAAESIVLARYWMLSRVYWHHSNRALMAMYKFVIAELIRMNLLGFTDYIERTFWKTEVEAAAILRNAFHPLVERGSHVDPLACLSEGRRDFYKRLDTVAHNVDPDLYRLLIEKRDQDITQRIAKRLEPILGEKWPKRGVVIVDIPKRARDKLQPAQIVIVNDRDAFDELPDSQPGISYTGAERALEKLSPVVREWNDEFLDQVKKCRVFIHPEAFRDLKVAGKLEEARAECRSELRKI